MQTTRPTAVGLAPSRLATIVASRFVLNTIFRCTYPLTQVLVLQTGISTERATWLITIQVLSGLLSPVSGWLGDRLGYRRLMTAGLVCSTLGALIVATTLNFAVLLLGFFIVGLGSTLYQPTMQAYVSGWTPVAQRGRALGTIELAWALAGIIGVPAVVALVQRTGVFGSGFAVLAGLFVALLLGMLVLPPDPPRAAADVAAGRVGLSILKRPTVWGLLMFLGLVLCAEEILFIVQPTWLAGAFKADAGTVATALAVFGWGELAGSLLAALFTDWLGVRRAPLVGFAGTALTYLALPALGTSWLGYLIGFGLFAFWFEFALVAAFSLASTVAPAQRGTVLSLSSTAIQLGRAAGGRIGIVLLPLVGLWGNAGLAAALTILAVVVGVALVHPAE